MIPLKMEKVPIVAEVPTCQKMLDGFAPPARMTWTALPMPLDTTQGEAERTVPVTG